MIEEQLGITIPPAEKQVVFVPSKEEKERTFSIPASGEGAALVYEWQEEVKPAAGPARTFLRILDPLGRRKQLPCLDAVLDGINGAEVPAHLLHPFLMKVQTIHIESLMVYADRDISLEDGQFESIRRLAVTGSGSLLFRRSNLPNARSLELRIDKKRKVIRSILEYDVLDLLSLTPASEDIDLKALASLGLCTLKLYSGNRATLAGIGDLQSLRGVWIQDMAKLQDVSELRRLHNLELLVVNYCKRIANIEEIASLPNLRRVLVFSSNLTGVRKLREDSDFMSRVELLSS